MAEQKFLGQEGTDVLIDYIKMPAWKKQLIFQIYPLIDQIKSYASLNDVPEIIQQKWYATVYLNFLYGPTTDSVDDKYGILLYNMPDNWHGLDFSQDQIFRAHRDHIFNSMDEDTLSLTASQIKDLFYQFFTAPVNGINNLMSINISSLAEFIDIMGGDVAFYELFSNYGRNCDSPSTASIEEITAQEVSDKFNA